MEPISKNKMIEKQVIQIAYKVKAITEIDDFLSVKLRKVNNKTSQEKQM